MSYKLDKNFKTLINKRFTTPDRRYYQEVGDKTLIIHRQEIWTDDIPENPSNAISQNVAQFYDKQVLTPDPVYPEQAYYFMVDNGSFTAGVDDFETGVINDAHLDNFISTKFGEQYKVKLYDNNENLIGETDSINWIFDYATGVLHISNPSSYDVPYKLSVYKYIGSYLPITENIGSRLNNLNKNMQAENTQNDGDLACNTEILEDVFPDSGINVYLNGVKVLNGNTSNDWCYFSSDGGTTKKAKGEEEKGDKLYWNGSISELQLDNLDSFSFEYLTNE